MVEHPLKLFKCMGLSVPNYQTISSFIYLTKQRTIVSSCLNILKTMALGIVAKGYFGRESFSYSLGLQPTVKRVPLGWIIIWMVLPGVVQCNIATLVILSVLISQSMQDKQIIQVKTEFTMQMCLRETSLIHILTTPRPSYIEILDSSILMS